MNRVAVWVAQTVGAAVPTALAQATASPLPEIAAGAGLDPDIAAPPVAMDVIHRLEGSARGALIQRAKIRRGRSASVSSALTVHPVTAANDSRIHDTNSSVPVPTRARHR
jgi:hypothetical protein